MLTADGQPLTAVLTGGREARRLLALAVGAAWVLAGCGAGRLLLPGVQPESRLLEYAEQSMDHITLWPLDGLACRNDAHHHAALLTALAGLVLHPDARRVSAETLEAIFNLAAHSAPQSGGRVGVNLVAGRGAILALALWCGEGYGEWVYVLNRTGDVLPVAALDGTVPLGFYSDAAWIGDAWAMVDHGGGSALPTSSLYLIRPLDGSWELVNAFEGRAVPWPLPLAAEPAYRFRGGYQRLVVSFSENGCAVDTFFEWVDEGDSGRYVLSGRRVWPWWCESGD